MFTVFTFGVLLLCCYKVVVCSCSLFACLRVGIVWFVLIALLCLLVYGCCLLFVWFDCLLLLCLV